MRVDVEEVRRLRESRDRINSVPFEDLEIYESGQRITVPPDRLEIAGFIGVTNDWLLEMRIWDCDLTETEDEVQ